MLFACGGTAGHINPALAVAQVLKARGIDCVFVGNKTGMESRLVRQAGFEFYEFRAMGIQRRLSFSGIVKNIKSVGLLLTSRSRSRAIIHRAQPDVVVGTGGYVSAPIVHTAALLGVPTLIHEQNAFPGVANKLLAPRVDKVLVAVERAGKQLRSKEPVIVTGNPVRQELFDMTRKEARHILGIAEDEVCILSFGGSLGADAINTAAMELMVHYRGRCRHIHAVGRATEDFIHSLESSCGSVVNSKGLDIRSYIDNMPVCLLAADVVICRAGAMTLAELTAVGRASVLVPSPNVAENHQYHNARVLSDAGAAQLLEERSLTGARLIELVDRLVSNADLRHDMEIKARALGVKNATQQIAEQVLKLLA